MYFNLPLPAREILRADDADLIYYQVLGTQGEFVSGERDFPTLPPR
jgi:two-component system, OmpR family, sensor histidine kinase TctE